MKEGDLVRVLEQDAWYGVPEISFKTGVVLGICTEHEKCWHILIEKRVYAISSEDLELLSAADKGENND